MKKLISIFFLASNILFAQFTPPESNSTVMVDNNYILKYPTASQFINANSIASQSWVNSMLTNTLINYPLKTETVLINSSDLITSPTRMDFVEANRIVTDDVVCVKVDTFRGTRDSNGVTLSVYWWEAEVKVISPNGDLLYRATTVWEDKIMYHSNLGIDDNNCEIYYYTSGDNDKNALLCANGKTRFMASSSGRGRSITLFAILSTSSIGDTYFSRPKSITGIEFYPNMNGTLPNGTSIREIFTNPANSIVVSRKNSEEYEKDFLNNKRVWRPATIIYYRKK